MKNKPNFGHIDTPIMPFCLSLQWLHDFSCLIISSDCHQKIASEYSNSVTVSSRAFCFRYLDSIKTTVELSQTQKPPSIKIARYFPYFLCPISSPPPPTPYTIYSNWGCHRPTGSDHLGGVGSLLRLLHKK